MGNFQDVNISANMQQLSVHVVLSWLCVMPWSRCSGVGACAGKVCARHWYDKSKHIFPASRWEVYDAEKDYSNYTVK